jgi:hypothetical protein
MPLVHILDKISEHASLALATGYTEMGNVGAYYLLNPKAIPALGVGNLALLGGISEIVGDTVYSKVIHPTLQNLM